MLHLFSKGDLDTGKLKFYACDNKSDFKELPPLVPEGSAVLVLETGEIYKINKTGEWKVSYTLAGGEGGYIPVKGEDYFTEEEINEIIRLAAEQAAPDLSNYATTQYVDEAIAQIPPTDLTGYATEDYVNSEISKLPNKEDIIEEVIALRKIKPYYDEQEKLFFANGVGITIDDALDNANVLVSYYLDASTLETVKIPYDVKFYGGGNGLVNEASYSSSFIIMNSGKVKSLSGGSLGKGNVGTTTIIINGGILTEGVGGGGSNNKIHNKDSGNSVGHAKIFFNGGKALVVYGGGPTGLSSVGNTEIEINGGDINYLTTGGSNGKTGHGKITINGGQIEVLQSVNRGSIEMSEITINNGTINKLYGGGETEDATVNGIYHFSKLHLLGGTINNPSIGKNGETVNANKLSGTYIPGIISDEIAISMNLVPIETVDTIIKKMSAWKELEG